MRELKFRVWCVDHNEWEKDTCTLSLNGVVLHGNFMSIRPENHIVTQYTGLKDEKKRDIYEKDIVKCSGHNDLMIVHYCDDMCMYVLLPVWENYNSYTSDTDNDFEDKMLWDNIRIEVVGNIFENPEYDKKELCEHEYEDDGDAMQIVCTKCGEHADVTPQRIDPIKRQHI